LTSSDGFGRRFETPVNVMRFFVKVFGRIERDCRILKVKSTLEGDLFIMNGDGSIPDELAFRA